MIGAIIDTACRPPGARCAERGGVLVYTDSPRSRWLSGWYISEAWSAAFMKSVEKPYGPPSWTKNMSMAVMRPSLRKPIFTRPCSPGRARPRKCSSWRVMRIITGLPAFCDSRAGRRIWTKPAILLPKPPPQYSETSTRSSGAMPMPRAAGPCVRSVLCVETYR